MESVFRFKLDQQAKFIDRVQNVEVREAKVKGRSKLFIFYFITQSLAMISSLFFFMLSQLTAGGSVLERIKMHVDTWGDGY